MSTSAPKKETSASRSLPRLLRQAAPEWKRLALGTAFLFGSQGSLLYFSLALKDLIDGISAANMALVNGTALTMLVVMTLGGVASGLRSYCFITSGEKAVARLRERLYQAILSQEVAFFDERRTGELMSRLSSDCAVLQGAMSTNISTLLRHASIVVGGVAVMAYRSWQLTLLMLAIVPFSALGSRMYARRVRKLSRDVQDALARAGEMTEESISGLRTVRAFAAEEREVRRYRQEIQRAFELARRRGRMAALFTGFTESTGMAVVIAMLWYGAWLSSGHRGLTAGALFSFIAVTLQVATSLGSLSEVWGDLLRATGAAERIFELLDRVPAIGLLGGERLERVRGEVRFEGLVFAYPTRRDVQVLKGLTLTLNEGEIVALVGYSGAGKSTVASLLARFYEPDGGRILLDGRDLRELEPSWLRQQIGIVAQEPILFSCSIADNIRYGRPDASDAEVEAAARMANAYDFIRRFPEGFNTLVGERGVQLSGGQKQRVAIARALLKDPRILILDEATSALDAESESLVKEAMDRLMKGRTTLIIAHRLSTVMDAHRVLVLDGGSVVQSGNHQTLMDEDGPYRRLVQLQLAAA